MTSGPPSPDTAQGPRWQAPRPAAVITVGPWTEAEGFSVTELWPGTRVWSTTPLEEDIWVEGSATFEGRIVGSGWTQPSSFRAESLSPGFGERWATGAHGSATCWVVDRARQQLHAYPDLLGGSSVFIAELGPGRAVSTSLRQLEILARRLGTPLDRSVEFQAERILLGNGGLWPSSFDDVHQLEHMRFVTITGTRLTEDTYATGERVLAPDASIPEIMEAIRADVQENVRAIAQAPAEFRVAHLTGGFDSRLVLGAILAEGVQDRFAFFTSGAVGTTDRTIADGLARQYSLARTPDSGLTAAPPRSVRERFLGPMKSSAGILGTGPNGQERPAAVVAAGGGYGELLRSFFRYRMPTYTRASSAEEILGRLWPNALNSRMCRPEFIEQVGERLLERLRRGASRGIPEHFDLDFFYLSLRNRYHIGMYATQWSTIGSRLDPLYSPHLISLGVLASAQDRVSNVHGFDLMDSFAPTLRHHPFDHERYDSHARELRPPHPSPLPDEGVIRWRHDPTDKPRATAPLLQTSPEQRDALVRRANSLGVNFWQVEWLPPARQALRRALREAPGGQLGSVMDMDYVRHLAEGTVQRRAEIRDVYTSLEALLWLSS